MKKFTKLITAALLMMSLVGCGNQLVSDPVVNISILNSKPELQTVLQQAVEDFEMTHPDIKIKVIKYNQSQAYQDKLVSMQKYGNTPTMILMDPAHLNFISEDIISLNEEKWLENIAISLSDNAKNEQGELIAFPFALEGIGFIYNEKVLSQAGVDPQSITSLSSLEAAFKKIEASGKGALIVANEDWSLANHFLPLAYSVQGNEGEGNTAFIESLQNGTANLKDNKAINGLLDTFDVMKNYNYFKEDPMHHSTAKCAELLGKGEVGFYYMGNWASGEILSHASSDTKLGFVPVPISDNSSDFGNAQITAVIKYLVVDGRNNSSAQQEAAKAFINWLVYDKAGQSFMIDKAKVIPGVDNNECPMEDELMKAIIDYQKAGHIIELNNAAITSDNAEVIGFYLRQYLNNEIDRELLLEQVAAHWAKSK